MNKYTEIILVFMFLLLASTTHGIDVEGIPYKENRTSKTQITEECVGGYVYIVAMSATGAGGIRGVSVVQVFEKADKNNRPPQPKQCGKGES